MIKQLGENVLARCTRACVDSKFKGYTPVNYHGLIVIVEIKMINNTEKHHWMYDHVIFIYQFIYT